MDRNQQRPTASGAREPDVNQGDLLGRDSYDFPAIDKAPHADTETSADSARRLNVRLKTLNWLVLAYIAERGGATCDEVEVDLGLKHQTASSRLWALAGSGKDDWGGYRTAPYIEATGIRRKARSENNQQVYVLTNMGLAKYQELKAEEDSK